MKSLVILLLVANIGYFGWQYNEYLRQHTSQARSVSPLPSGAPRLKLVNELEQLPPLRDEADGSPHTASSTAPTQPKVSSKSLPGTGGVASDVCINVGPFPTGGELSKFQTWLGARAATMQTRTETIRKRQLFWIYLEPRSESMARESLADLQSKGVRDYLLIRRGGLKNAISLGLFSSQAAVNRRLAEMNRKGYKPVVVPRFETTDRHWIKANLARGHEDVTEVPGDLLGTAQLWEINCSEIADPMASS